MNWKGAEMCGYRSAASVHDGRHGVYCCQAASRGRVCLGSSREQILFYLIVGWSWAAKKSLNFLYVVQYIELKSSTDTEEM